MTMSRAAVCTSYDLFATTGHAAGAAYELTLPEGHVPDKL